MGDAVINGDDEGDLQLCRLKDTGHPKMWGFALFTYGSERYEDNVLPTGPPTGLPIGSPEDALDCAASLYLGNDPHQHRQPPKYQRGAALGRFFRIGESLVR